MIIPCITNYATIKKTQSFGKKKRSNVSDYRIAEDTIKNIKDQLSDINRKINSANNGINSKETSDDYRTRLTNIILPDLQAQKDDAINRLDKWEKIKSNLEKILGI